jgi:hypothetical protein
VVVVVGVVVVVVVFVVVVAVVVVVVVVCRLVVRKVTPGTLGLRPCAQVVAVARGRVRPRRAEGRDRGVLPG